MKQVFKFMSFFVIISGGIPFIAAYFGHIFVHIIKILGAMAG